MSPDPLGVCRKGRTWRLQLPAWRDGADCDNIGEGTRAGTGPSGSPFGGAGGFPSQAAKVHVQPGKITLPSLADLGNPCATFQAWMGVGISELL